MLLLLVALLDHLDVTNATLVMHDWSGMPWCIVRTQC
jgi:pimeloyl-ACP methyl ester carboxylesterase